MIGPSVQDPQATPLAAAEQANQTTNHTKTPNPAPARWKDWTEEYQRAEAKRSLETEKC